jgi:hypothetical protein
MLFYGDEMSKTFNGTYTDNTIASDTDPWVEINGEPVDWVARNLPADPDNDCECCNDMPVPGVIAPMNTPQGIERCDECQRFEGDLDAAFALAKLVNGTVHYEGE